MIVLGIGSSIEPKEKYLLSAVQELEAFMPVTKISKVYRTAAWGGVAENEFLNICVAVDYAGRASELLKIINAIELKLDRVRDVHWADRTIDIDIIFFNDEVINSESLIVPHKFLEQRNFVLLPLIDIVGDRDYKNKKLSTWLSEITDNIEIYKNKLELKG